MAEPVPVTHPIRILVLGMSWPPETFLERLLTGLAQRGFEITVSGSSRPRDAGFRQSGFRWLTIPSSNAPMPVRMVRQAASLAAAAFRSPTGIVRLSRAIEGEDGKARFRRLTQLSPLAGRLWEIIYFPWNSAAIEMLPVFDLGMPVVVSCRGSQVKVAPHNPTRTTVRDGLAATFQKASFVHCVSRDILEEACKYSLDPGKACIVRPAVDTQFFSPTQPHGASRPGSPFRVITTGSLNWKKGHEFALVAVAQVRARGVPVRFEIVGDGPERQRILYTVDDLGLNDCVELPGRLDPGGVRDRLRAADAFLLSSVSEGISNSVLEAMACGLPVVTTDCGGLREVVTDGVEGLVVPVRNPTAMADALASLAADPTLLDRLGRAARARAEHEFKIETQLDRWDDMCRRAVAGPCP
jgi:colanic acid/amylovoran biosynthesis glycosyltransferase